MNTSTITVSEITKWLRKQRKAWKDFVNIFLIAGDGDWITNASNLKADNIINWIEKDQDLYAKFKEEFAFYF